MATRDDMTNRYRFDDHKIRFITERCRGAEVLDLGCVYHSTENIETAFWVHGAIRQVASRVVGLDIHEEGIEELRRRGYEVVRADACHFDLGETFDVIVAGDIIEHLANHEGFFLSCRRHLRPGGRLLISTPNPWYWRNVVKSAIRPEVNNNPEHTCWFCVRTLRQLAARYGFEIREVAFGSRFLRDRMLPLPLGIKHTSFHTVLDLGDSILDPNDRGSATG